MKQTPGIKQGVQDRGLGQRPSLEAAPYENESILASVLSSRHVAQSRLAPLKLKGPEPNSQANLSSLKPFETLGALEYFGLGGAQATELVSERMLETTRVA